MCYFTTNCMILCKKLCPISLHCATLLKALCYLTTNCVLLHYKLCATLHDKLCATSRTNCVLSCNNCVLLRHKQCATLKQTVHYLITNCVLSSPQTGCYLTTNCALPSNSVPTSLLGCPRGVMVKAMNCGIVVRWVRTPVALLRSLRANTLGKGMNPLFSLQLWVN